MYYRFCSKVYVFLEGNKKWHNLHRRLDTYLVNVKSTVKILFIFVDFLDNMNFKVNG